ncbi:response regulator [Paenibacillus sedimenti]|uniref:response regulator n=1 Tax=Paenibacillus sedimenti TaxID=2770274 RepID=UPI0028977344|nr:response regulator [Paenibacillus sedimenti]
MILIIMVDDHPSVGQGTKYMIEEESDMKATVVSMGMQALELLKCEMFDLLIIDLNMPVINGGN